MIDYVWLVPLLPLIGFIINGIFGSRLSKSTVGFIGCSTIGIAFLISISIFFHVLNLPPELRSIEKSVFTWITSGVFSIDISFLIDPLSLVMLLVVTGVGFLIHVYSIGYMHDDKAYWRYFAYLNFFVFFMLLLVLGANYFVLFLGWEGVGLCSYLLIGFWYEKKSASDAGKKAFVVNRIGDFGFILGLFLLFWSLGDVGEHSLRYKDVFENAHHLSPSLVTAITLLLFVGAIGKSAQIPLYVWLPDAMEGPTPVSALIHAATMVTAGVYMIARNSVLFSMAPFTGEVVAVVGIATALFAATIGLVQNDIKKVLAYSTVSQLGYMFAAVGVGAYAAGIFHLMTHAFFKGLLFLGSGSVIHGLSRQQDMRKMGALFPHMKYTAVTFIIGALAIAGIPPLSGFWSKDEILWEAFKEGHYIIWTVGLITAFLTAFYMFRQVFMTFFGDNRVEKEAAHHLHESPGVMTGPLIILAILAVVAGLAVGIPFEGGSTIHHFLEPSFSVGAVHSAHEVVEEAAVHHGNLEFILMGVSILVAFAGFFLAAFLYSNKLRSAVPRFLLPENLAVKYSRTYTLLYNKYYIDEIYDALIVNPIKRLCHRLLSFDLLVVDGIVNACAWLTRTVGWISHQFDIYIVDGIINSAATLVGVNSGMWRRLQSGYLQNYAFIIAVGACIIIGSILFF